MGVVPEFHNSQAKVFIDTNFFLLIIKKCVTSFHIEIARLVFICADKGRCTKQGG